MAVALTRPSHEVIVGALHPDYMREIEEGLDRRASKPCQGLYGPDDPDLRNLLLLLAREAERGGPYGTLYAESLIAALATRLLHAVRLEKPPAQTEASPTLASESGYSRAQFLRMFRVAIGQTPHRYLLELRLEKARGLMASRMRLADIASVCGFSSHAHLTTAFRTKLAWHQVHTGASRETFVADNWRKCFGHSIELCSSSIRRWSHTGNQFIVRV